MYVIKSDGTKQKFDPSKIRTWVSWAGPNPDPKLESEILQSTLSRLSEEPTTSEIHQTVISVCLDMKTLDASALAANLELATIFKNMEKHLRVLEPAKATFIDLLDIMVAQGVWAGEWTEDPDLDTYAEELNHLYFELEAHPVQFWVVKQWVDKYSRKLQGEPIETPALGALALAISLHGVTERAFHMARGIVYGKQNYPTPMLNGCRTGEYNLISCCVIEAQDSIESIDIAEYIASQMTARKAGIGINLVTRSKGDGVRRGAVKHLGKHPLYASLEKTVKKYTQETRGGSATTTFTCIDPEILDQLKWKSQQIDIARRIDKLDFEFAYNDDFARAVRDNADWYLFSLSEAPEVWANFHAQDYMDYVRKAVLGGAKYTKIKAREIIEAFSHTRWETGRLYMNNLTRTNQHTPFDGTPGNVITQSNLCEEIALPTRGFLDLYDLLKEDSYGEVAFCTIAALNVQEFDSDEEYIEHAETVVYTLNRAIELAAKHAPTPSLRSSLLRRRSLGIGITGLAGRLYKEGFDYDGSDESLQLVAHLSDLHYYALLRASQKYAEETGTVCGAGVDLDWLPIDTADVKFMEYETPFDWEALRGKPRANSVLSAHMPTESSAVFSGATNGLYPSRKKVIAKKARTGKVQFISKHFDPDKHMSVWDIDMNPYYGVIQAYGTDQAISADHYTDFHKYPGSKIPMEDCIELFISQWWHGVKTGYYQNFRDMDDLEKLEEQVADDCCKL